MLHQNLRLSPPRGGDATVVLDVRVTIISKRPELWERLERVISSFPDWHAVRGLCAQGGGPTYVFVDLIEGQDAHDALDALRARRSGLCVMLLTSGDTSWVTPGRLGEDVRAVVRDDLDEASLRAVLQLVMTGHSVVWGATDEDAAPAKVRSAEDTLPALTSREQDVLKLLCRGASNKSIAQQLSLSDHTVSVHVRAILRKLRVGNRTQAALRAQRAKFGSAADGAVN